MKTDIIIDSGPLAIRSGYDRLKRNIIICIVKDIVNDEFLCLQRYGKDVFSFVGGGIDEGENLIQAGIREIQEETGYVDFTYKGKIGDVVHQKAFAPAKNTNYETYAQGLYFELNTREINTKVYEHHKQRECVRKNKEAIGGIGRSALDMVEVRNMYQNGKIDYYD